MGSDVAFRPVPGEENEKAVSLSQALLGELANRVLDSARQHFGSGILVIREDIGCESIMLLKNTPDLYGIADSTFEIVPVAVLVDANKQSVPLSVSLA